LTIFTVKIPNLISYFKILSNGTVNTHIYLLIYLDILSLISSPTISSMEAPLSNTHIAVGNLV
jgi:hypothetical protein